MTRAFVLSFSLGLVLLASSCVGPSGTARKEPGRPTPGLSIPTNVQRGVASWYGSEFHGNPTASGEFYNMHDLTAAHKTLPLGAFAMVTNLENHRSVEVRINDRGPFLKGRIIDLSYAAARAIDMVEKGTARVEVVALGVGEIPLERAPVYAVQVGSFNERENAERLLREVRREFREAYMTVWETPQGSYYRVRVGRFKSQGEAHEVAQRLASSGHSVLITSR